MDRVKLEREQGAAAGRDTVQRLAHDGSLLDTRPATAQLAQQQAWADGSPRVAQLQEIADIADAATVQRNDTGMPDSLKAGIESLSGMDMSAVRVHRNSGKPAQLNAHAYAQGTDIHLAPGQEQHLPHEAWHVVQQMQGRVRPTAQMKEAGVSINDDTALEREADRMGGQAAQLRGVDSGKAVPPGRSVRPSEVAQRVKGGIEFTEDRSMLWAYNNIPGNVPAHRNFQAGAATLSGFRVATGSGFNVANADLGTPTNQDFQVMAASPNVKLTNDVQSAEWVIERHAVDVPADTMRRNLRSDIDAMFAARSALVTGVGRLQQGHAGEAAIAPGPAANINAVSPVFIYRPGPNVGKAQVTAMYTKEDTVRRINKLNVSKYLIGSKVAEGEDIPRIAGTADRALYDADIAGTTSFSSAETLLTDMRNASLPIPASAGGPVRLAAAQVGLIKLMVLNDALATTMVRYQDVVGQAQEKNIQRFFPKSRRNEYVKAIARADLDAVEMAALHTEIQRTSVADAQRLFNAADPGALRTDEAFRDLGLGHATMPGMLTAKGQLANPALGVPLPADLLNIKNAVLGANGAILAAWINIAAGAYTDFTAHGNQHVFHDPGKVNQTQADIAAYGAGNGGVVSSVLQTSAGFTPVAGGDRGAIYEMREREIGIDRSGLFNFGSLSEIHAAIDGIFNAAT